MRDHVSDDAMAVAGSGAEGGVGGGVAEGGAIGVERAEDGGVKSVEEEEGAGEDGGGGDDHFFFLFLSFGFYCFVFSVLVVLGRRLKMNRDSQRKVEVIFLFVS